MKNDPLVSEPHHESELLRLQQALTQAAEEAEQRKNEIALLQRRLAAAEQRHQAAELQLRKLSQPHLRDVRDRLRLAIALDDPNTLHSTDAVMAEIARLRTDAAEAAKARDRMYQREAELLSSTSWRVTAPLRALSQLLRQGS